MVNWRLNKYNVNLLKYNIELTFYHGSLKTIIDHESLYGVPERLYELSSAYRVISLSLSL